MACTDAGCVRLHVDVGTTAAMQMTDAFLLDQIFRYKFRC
jgi:hypothetical protein